jgi:hypothetical protein
MANIINSLQMQFFHEVFVSNRSHWKVGNRFINSEVTDNPLNSGIRRKKISDKSNYVLCILAFREFANLTFPIGHSAIIKQN